MRKSWLYLGLIIVLFLSLNISLSQSDDNVTRSHNVYATEEPVSLSDIGAYRTTCDGMSSDTKASMKVGNVKYYKGIQLHAYDCITYFNLNGEYSHLKGLLGVDDKTYNDVKKVSVVFSGDGKDLSAVELNNGDLPINLDLDVSGVRQFNVKINTKGGYDAADVDLIDMKLNR